MRLTITTLNDNHLFVLDVGEDMEVENLKALCEFESGIDANQMVVMHEGKPLVDGKKDLKSYNIKDGDFLLVQRIEVNDSRIQVNDSGSNSLFDFGSIQVPQQSSSLDFGSFQVPQPSSTSVSRENPESIRNMLLSNPEQVAVLKVNNPRLAEALEKSLEEFTQVLNEQQQQRAEENRRRIRMLVADPFDTEAQKMIAEEIQQQQIDSNMETALEYHPESYGRVTMLYIHCKVNGFPIKAFVDSGAESTIMSKACAERCNIMRLVDTRWSGIAKGVGTQRILGRVHLVQIQIGNDHLASSFTILENQSMDMLLGLDMLKRHQCSIDLKRNILIIGTTGAETEFLNESDLPEFAKHQVMSPQHDADDTDEQLAEAINRSVKDMNSSKASASNSSATNNSFPESDIKQLVDYGFPREQVIKELRNFNGNKDQALASLFAKSLNIPK